MKTAGSKKKENYFWAMPASVLTYLFLRGFFGNDEETMTLNFDVNLKAENWHSFACITSSLRGDMFLKPETYFGSTWKETLWYCFQILLECYVFLSPASSPSKN